MKANKYTITLGVLLTLAMILLLCQPVEGLSDLQFLAVLAVTKIGGALLVWLLVKLAAKWTEEGKINLGGLYHDTDLN